MWRSVYFQSLDASNVRAHQRARRSLRQRTHVRQRERASAAYAAATHTGSGTYTLSVHHSRHAHALSPIHSTHKLIILYSLHTTRRRRQLATKA